jgi:hypothetical protein
MYGGEVPFPEQLTLGRDQQMMKKLIPNARNDR